MSTGFSAENPECSKLIEFCKSGWPTKHAVKGELKKFWQVRAELTYNKDLLLYGSRNSCSQHTEERDSLCMPVDNLRGWESKFFFSSIGMNSLFENLSKNNFSHAKHTWTRFRKCP